MKIKSYLMAALGFAILVGSIILAQPFVSHSQSQISPTPVTVTNTPLEIRSVEEAPPCCVPRRPFRKSFFLVGEDGKSGASSDFVVPSGKRLVIENVSVRGQIPAGEQLQVGFNYTASGTLMRQEFPVTFQVHRSSEDVFVASQQMRVYVDGDENIHFFGVRNPTHDIFQVVFSFSGYLVDLP